MTLGDRFRAIRKHFDLNATQMGQRVGLGGRSSWERYERGENVPNGDILLHLAEMGVSADWLLTGNGEMLKSATPDAMEGAPSTLDEELHGRVVDGITAAYKEMGQAIAPVHLGRMTARLINEIMAASDGPEDYPGALKLRLAQLRNELRTAASDPTSSKRSA